MLAVGSAVLCVMKLRGGEQERRWLSLVLLAVDAVVLAVILLVTAYFFGLVPRSGLWQLAADIGGWFFHMPSPFALM